MSAPVCISRECTVLFCNEHTVIWNVYTLTNCLTNQLTADDVYWSWRFKWHGSWLVLSLAMITASVMCCQHVVIRVTCIVWTELQRCVPCLLTNVRRCQDFASLQITLAVFSVINLCVFYILAILWFIIPCTSCLQTDVFLIIAIFTTQVWKFCELNAIICAWLFQLINCWPYTVH